MIQQLTRTRLNSCTLQLELDNITLSGEGEMEVSEEGGKWEGREQQNTGNLKVHCNDM